MADGFVHEYEVSSDEEKAPTEAPKLKFPRTARQAAGTAKGLEALARRRAEATEKKVAQRAAAGSMPAPQSVPTEGAAAGGSGAGAGAGSHGAAGASAPAAPAAARPKAAAKKAEQSQAAPGAPYSAAGGAASDPLLLARLAQMEMEMATLRARARRGPSKPRAAVSEEDDEEEDAEEDEAPEEEEEDEEEPPKPAKRRRASSSTPAPKKRATKPASKAPPPPPSARQMVTNEPKVDFFDALMASQFGRRW